MENKELTPAVVKAVLQREKARIERLFVFHKADLIHAKLKQNKADDVTPQLLKELATELGLGPRTVPRTTNHKVRDYLSMAALLRAEIEEFFPLKRDWVCNVVQQVYPKVSDAEIERVVDSYLAGQGREDVSKVSS